MPPFPEDHDRKQGTVSGVQGSEEQTCSRGRTDALHCLRTGWCEVLRKGEKTRLGVKGPHGARLCHLPATVTLRREPLRAPHMSHGKEKTWGNVAWRLSPCVSDAGAPGWLSGGRAGLRQARAHARILRTTSRVPLDREEPLALPALVKLPIWLHLEMCEY